MKEGEVEEDSVRRDGLAGVRSGFVMPVPKTVPRIDYERIFVLDEDIRLLGEYALDDECPLEFRDLLRAIPASGMRHLVSFYQGEYVFTPFRIEGLWFVVLTRGAPRIEERGSIGTLLAALRVHLPSSLSRSLAAREAAVWKREREVDARESRLERREQRVTHLETDVQTVAGKLREIESNVRARETRLNALREYAIQMQRSIRQSSTKANPPRESAEDQPPSDVMVPRLS